MDYFLVPVNTNPSIDRALSILQAFGVTYDQVLFAGMFSAEDLCDSPHGSTLWVFPGVDCSPEDWPRFRVQRLAEAKPIRRTSEQLAIAGFLFAPPVVVPFSGGI
ncbi:MAG: hypothetical protein EA417_01925 [Gammaproteobacteria bacterium]|nr:MAG: hypothetical protein EA417_01925 [Gammaproteobacteria bacterium]